MKKLSLEFIKENDLIEIEDHSEEVCLSPYTGTTRIPELIQAFISALDVRQSSRVTTQKYIQSLTDETRLKNPAERLIDAMF